MNHKKVGLPLIMLLSATALSGCVTQDTYTGTDTLVSERKVDKVADQMKKALA